MKNGNIGYGGLQNTESGKTVIMSMWNKGTGYPDVTVSRKYPAGADVPFDNEGSGSKWIRSFNWNDNQWYTMVFSTWEDAETHNTYIGEWLKDINAGKWYLVAYYDSGVKNSAMKGGMGVFQENYSENVGGDVERSFKLRKRYGMDHANSQWVSLNRSKIFCGDLSMFDRSSTFSGKHEFGIAYDYLWGLAGGYVDDQEAYDANNSAVLDGTMVQPDKPSFDAPNVTAFRASKIGNQVGLLWNVGDDGAPMLTYQLKAYGKNGNVIYENYITRPETTMAYMSNVKYEDIYKIEMNATDIFKRSFKYETIVNQLEESTTKKDDKDYSNLDYVDVVGSDGKYKVASVEDFGIQDARVNNDGILIIPKVCSGSYPIWPTFGNERINGVPGIYSFGAGITIPFSELEKNEYTIYTATSSVKDYDFNIVVKKCSSTEAPTEKQTEEITTEEPTTEKETEALVREDVIKDKAITASTVLGGQVAKFATDGNVNTRWETPHGLNEPQWIQVDLGGTYKVDSFYIDWEVASAKEYEFQVSMNGTDWQTVKKITDGKENEDRTESFGQVEAKYVRVYCTARTTVYGYSIWEMNVYGTKVSNETETEAPSVHNILPGQNIYASSVLGGQAAALAIDNNIDTRWETAHGLNTPQWIRVDLDKTYKISSFKIDWEVASAKEYEFQVSMNGTDWQTVKKITDGKENEDRYETFSEVEAKYIRVYCTARTTVYGYSIWEMEVFGR